jgi:protein-L-isoaspartate(D-aspartate) O-methyltransferase
MPPSPNGSAIQYRKALVEELKKQDGLLDPALEAAFLAVPRHLFLPAETLEKAYADDAIAIKRDSDGAVLSSSSQPSMMALMLRQLRLRKGDNVLEIGAGTGYNAAIMQHLVGEKGAITSVELDNQLAEQAIINLQRLQLGDVVTIVNADGALGYAPHASYDRIIATVSLWDIPTNWTKQLKTDGILVAPIWLESMQVSGSFVIQPDGTLYSRLNIPCGFVPLRGIAAVPNFSRRVSSSALMLSSNDIDKIDGAAMHALLTDTPEIALLSASLTSNEYWRGFVPYLTLNIPQDYVFASFTVGENQQAYGLEGSGFVLMGPGSACFASYKGQGEVVCFGSADAFIALNEMFEHWDAVGRPSSDLLRLQFFPKGEGFVPTPRPNARIYSRQYHDIQVWLDNKPGS